MLDRSQIGRDSGERFAVVEASQVRLFRQAIGEPVDEGLAPGDPVPPTFANTLNYLAPAARDLVLDVLGAPLGKMLHGEQRFFFERPIRVGDRIRLSTRIADIYDKKGGALEFIVLDTTFHNEAGELCATMRSVAVLRH